MGERMYKGILFLMIVAALPAISFANNGVGNGAVYVMLNASLAQIQCQLNFTTTVVNDYIGAVNGSTDILTQLTVLQQNVAQLETYASSGNVSMFETYLHQDFDKGMAVIRQLMKDGLAGAALGSAKVKILRSQYADARTQLHACQLSALGIYGNAKTERYNAVLQQYTNVSDKLASRGIDTSSLDSILNNATSQVVVPLQIAVKNATNESEMRSAVMQYCIFNGCANGINFHLAARFDLQKLQLITNKLQALNNSAVNSTALANAESYLNNASGALKAVGTSTYTNETKIAVWGNMDNAVAALQAAISSR